MHRFGLVSLLVGIVTVCVGGIACQPTAGINAAASDKSPLAAADVDLPPKELLEAVELAVTAPPLSLGVQEQNKGTIVTGWKRHRGDWHIGRYWQERTRYRIEVSPDWDDPMAQSRMLVIAETQQRAAEGQRWDREARVARPRRAEATLKAILDHVSRTSAK